MSVDTGNLSEVLGTTIHHVERSERRSRRYLRRHVYSFSGNKSSEIPPTSSNLCLHCLLTANYRPLLYPSYIFFAVSLISLLNHLSDVTRNFIIITINLRAYPRKKIKNKFLVSRKIKQYIPFSAKQNIL